LAGAPHQGSLTHPLGGGGGVGEMGVQSHAFGRRGEWEDANRVQHRGV
jgi:hypothetical protein